MRLSKIARTKKVLDLIERDKIKALEALNKLEKDLQVVKEPVNVAPAFQEKEDTVSKLPDELRGLKWEIVSERYIKTKFEKFHKWFRTIENKFTQIDNDINAIQDRMEKLESSVSYHENLLITETAEAIAQRNIEIKNEDAKKEEDKFPRVLDFLEK